MKTNNETTISEKIIEGLKGALSEIEEFGVQLNLGKAEAKDLYEEVKKKFKLRMHEAKARFEDLKNNEDVLKVINAFESLQVQLALGMAETADKFEEQRKKIELALHELEQNLQDKTHFKEHYSELKLEFEKFKIKVQLLGLKYKLHKIATEYGFAEKKAKFMQNVDDLKKKLNEKESKVAQKWEHFSDEISEAYEHLKKAFT